MVRHPGAELLVSAMMCFMLQTLTCSTLHLSAKQDVKCVVWHPGDKLPASASYNVVSHAANPDKPQILVFQPSGLQVLNVAPRRRAARCHGSQTLVSQLSPNTDLTPNSHVTTLRDIECVVRHPGGELLASASYDVMAHTPHPDMPQTLSSLP